MFERLNVIKETYESLQKQLMESEFSVENYKKINKELKGLEKAYNLYKNYLKIIHEIDELKTILALETDQEMLDMTRHELKDLELQTTPILEALKISLLPSDPNDTKDVIVEIKGAAGGDEANIFAGDLFRMYLKYAETNGWKVEVLSATEGKMGGFTNIEFLVSGDLVYSFLKYESGIHRVQRVPETESQGRVHTSTAVVIVLPEAEDLEIDISWADIRVDTFTSSGPGGQSVNTTQSAVRLTHIPTGVSVASQEGKSQHENKAKAFTILKARIYDKFLQEKLEKEGAERKLIAGSGDRSEKIRTYNYPQNRVTDHRIGLTLQRLDVIINGKLDLIIEPLINTIQAKLLSEGSHDI